MKKHIAFLITAALAACLFAQTSVVPVYPRVEITPRYPMAGDDVELRLIKGMHTNSLVPTYTTGYTIEMSPLLIYPPIYNIHLTYTETWPEPGGIGLAVMTEYGPRFTFESLDVGSYRVFDGGENIYSFAVNELAYEISGSVYDDPLPLKRMSLPISGAKVYLKVYNYSMIIDQPVDGYIIQPLSGYLIVDSAVTDEKGGYLLPPAAPGSYHLTFTAEGFRPLDIDLLLQKDTTVNAQLVPGDASATVSGSVMAAQRPVNDDMGMPVILEPLAGCTVTVWYNVKGAIPDPPVTFPQITYSEGGAAKAAQQLIEYYTAVTDGDGAYSIEDIPVYQNGQSVLVTARKDGYLQGSENAEIYNSFITDMDFMLDRNVIVANMPENTGKAGRSHGSLKYSSADRQLVMDISRAQVVEIEAYLLNGIKLDRLSTKRYFEAGRHVFDMDTGRLGNGVLLVRVLGEDFSETKKINLVGKGK